MAVRRDQIIASAEKLVARGKIEPAIREYKQLLDDNPNDVNTLNRIGDLWVRINRNDEAIQCFTRIADHYAKDGFFLKSIALYKKVSKLDPARLEAHAKLADLYAKQGLAMEAKSQYEVLADSYVKAADFSAAARIYRKIAELDSNSVAVRNRLADLLAQTNQPDDAIKQYIEMGRMLLKRDLLEESVHAYRKAMNVGPQGMAMVGVVVRDLISLKNLPAARRITEPMIEQNPDDPAALEVFAEICVQEGDRERARSLLRPLFDAAIDRQDAKAAIRYLAMIGVEPVPQGQLDLFELRMAWLRFDARSPWRAFVEAQAHEIRDVESTYVPRRVSLGSEGDVDALQCILDWTAKGNGGIGILLGPPGSGKTTLLHAAVHQMARKKDGPVPILIRGREFGRAINIEQAIIERLLSRGMQVSWADCRLPLQRGDLVIFLDGLDEIMPATNSTYGILRAISKIVDTTNARVVITTREQDVSLAAVRQEIPTARMWRLLPFDRAQIERFILSHIEDRERTQNLLDALERNERLWALAHSPLMLRILVDLDLDVIRSTDFTGDLIRTQCARAAKRGDATPEDVLSTLTLIAMSMWTTAQQRLPIAEIEQILPFPDVPYEALIKVGLTEGQDTGFVSFAHLTFFEWLVAYAITRLREPSFPVERVLSQGIVQFFCDIAGRDPARTWATFVLAHARNENEKATAEAVLRHLGESPARDQQPAIANTEADAHEETGRSLLVEHNYQRAASELGIATQLDPGRTERIHTEFGFLLGPNAYTGSRLRWCTDFWRTITLPIEGIQRIETRQEQPAGEDAQAAQAPAVVRRETAPQVAGAELEEATLRLFRQFFSLTEADEGQFRFQLLKLRKQKTGSQFGYDLAFEASVAGNANVRCHIECKNYASTVALKDVADKLLQQRSHGVKIDHWILVSPHADPSQDLHHFLEYESTTREFPFDIHVWSPETNVAEFFALEPAVYEKFYAAEHARLHPHDWPAEKKSAVIERYRRLLQPVHRLPPGWQDYVDHDHNLCFSDSEQQEFARVYDTAVPLSLKDQNGFELPGTAIDRLMAWLDEPSPRVAFVLGEFGDGKSFLTYALSRKLLRRFRESPEEGAIPLRLALREFVAARTVREFLEARLEMFGASLAGWAELKRTYKTLVILDGFDEISKELDAATITQNIRDLIQCCTATVFDSCKILITSRTHFFETGDAARLLQRLNSPVLLQLSRIPRGQVLGHLQAAAKGPEEHDLLERLTRMHDPIGLGTKPLFLQMLKDTLHDLPVDLDEISVYDSYARKSLERKVDLLDDPQFQSSREDSIQHLLSVLGVIAEELQASTEPYVSLKKLREKTGPYAEVLWRLAGEKGLEDDARARIGTRSLLSRVHAFGGDGEWRVDFCHRSIREYFVARQFGDCLLRGAEDSAKFLRRVPVNHEILYFTACLLRRSGSARGITSLREIIERSVAGEDTHALGGRALTILLRVARTLPRDLQLAKRNLDFADLEDADLSGFDFSGSTLRGANFTNANLEDANLSGCDLTGVRLNETTSVLGVVARSGETIFAAYEDGTIWEWNVAGGGKPSSRIVHAQPGLKLSRLGITRSGVAWGIAGRNALLFGVTPAEHTH